MRIRAAKISCIESRYARGATQQLLMNQGTKVAGKYGSSHGVVALGRAVDPDFASYQSSVVQVLIHAAGFAMLSLTAVMVLGCVLAI